MTHDQIIDLLHRRHSCREFTDQTVSKQDLSTILEAGRLAPNSMGKEPWRFVVISKESPVMQELIPLSWAATKQLETCSHLIVVLNRNPNDMQHDSAYLDHIIRNVQQRPEERIEPFKTIIRDTINAQRLGGSAEALNNYAVLQTYLATAYMSLTASMLGVDTCIMGGYDEAKATEVLITHGLLDPAHFNLSIFLAVGYGAAEPTPKKRQAFDDVVVWA